MGADLANEYMRVINDVAEEGVGFVMRDIPFTFILSQPGVLQVVEAEVDVMSEWDVVGTAMQSAIQDLLEMRQTEGASLKADLERHLQELDTLVSEVSASADGVNERLRERMSTRIQRLLGERLEEGRLMQEAAVLATRSSAGLWRRALQREHHLTAAW